MQFQYGLLMCFACICSSQSGAQISVADSSLIAGAITYAKQVQQTRLGENYRLYNGVIHDVKYLATKGHPYFENNVLTSGSLHYDGSQYEHVPLLYDLVEDEVLIESYDQLHYLQLVKNKIPSFSIDGHLFIQLQEDSTQETSLPAGFYEELHHHELLVLAKRTKKLLKEARGEVLDARFKSYDQYYIRLNNIFYLVSSNSSLLSVLKDQKNTLRTYLRKNKLNFKKDPTKTIIKASIYYEQLSK